MTTSDRPVYCERCNRRIVIAQSNGWAYVPVEGTWRSGGGEFSWGPPPDERLQRWMRTETRIREELAAIQGVRPGAVSMADVLRRTGSRSIFVCPKCRGVARVDHPGTVD